VSSTEPRHESGPLTLRRAEVVVRVDSAAPPAALWAAAALASMAARLAGHVVVPAVASTGVIPQKRASGGAGRSPAMRDCSTPRPSVPSQISWDSTSPATGRSYG